jgi:hypothetical protein
VSSEPGARPWLRGALARLAHDDPDAGARLLLGLAPALRAVAGHSIDFDLTIRGSGTYGITLDATGTAVRPLGRPRGRREAAFHVTASATTLAEVAAGVRKRIGRWQGSVRVSGRRGEAVALADALRNSRLSLAAAAGAGADLPPDLVFAAFPYAIDPAWTRGHRFTVAQEITDLPGAAFVIVAHDGTHLTVSRTPPAGGADATVTMTRATFAALLRGTPATGERRPVVRGNRAAVAALKGWTDRAQGIAR